MKFIFFFASAEFKDLRWFFTDRPVEVTNEGIKVTCLPAPAKAKISQCYWQIQLIHGRC